MQNAILNTIGMELNDFFGRCERRAFTLLASQLRLTLGMSRSEGVLDGVQYRAKRNFTVSARSSHP